MRRTQYIVEIHFREPTYELRYGPRDEPYRFRYRIEAGDEKSASWFALQEFRRVTEMSSVGWARDVVSVDVRPALT